MEQLRIPQNDRIWTEIKDGDPDAMKLYRRHYSYRKYADGRIVKLFCGPGEKTVLMTPDCRALFVWRKFISMDNQEGVNCAVFRNETEHKASDMILEAEEYATGRWGPCRVYTYVNPKKIESHNPGYCFKCAGWTPCGETKGGLVVLEKWI